jgi:hypothetical protein
VLLACTNIFFFVLDPHNNPKYNKAERSIINEVPLIIISIITHRNLCQQGTIETAEVEEHKNKL